MLEDAWITFQRESIDAIIEGNRNTIMAYKNPSRKIDVPNDFEVKEYARQAHPRKKEVSIIKVIINEIMRYN
jgi:hypothetical protein